MSTAPRLVTCPTCQGKFPAGGGAISVCPRCGERVLVPSLDDDLTPAPPPPAKPMANVPVECGLCGSRYYAKPEQVGTTIRCPDCHTNNVVTEPEAKKPATAPPPLDDDDDFKLSDPVDTPQYRALAADALEFERAIRSGSVSPTSPPPKPEATPTAAPLPAVATQSTPTKNPTPPSPRVGETTSVRTPPTANVPPAEIDLFPEDGLQPVPRAVPQPRSVEDQPAFDEHDEVPFNPQLSEVVDRPQHRPVPQLPNADALDDDDGSDFGKSLRKFLPEGPAPELPQELGSRRPFSKGLLSFLLQPAVLARWIGMCLFVIVEVFALRWILESFAEGGAAQIGGFFIYLVAYFPALVGIGAMAVFCLTIFQDTANGHDRIQNWPEFSILEWAISVLYIAAAFFVAGLPGALFSTALTSIGLPLFITPLLFFPSLFLLFPPVLISMLEAGTITEPISAQMLRSFGPLSKFWLAFYGLSIGLGLLGAFVVPVAIAGHILFLVPGAILMTAIPFIYFRVLGRMAMMYRDYVFATSPDEDDDSPSERHVLQ